MITRDATLNDQQALLAEEIIVRVVFGIVVGLLSFFAFLFVSRETAKKSVFYGFAIALGYFLFYFLGQENEPLSKIDEYNKASVTASSNSNDLRNFLEVFIVNNENFSYPIKVSESTYLISRSIIEKSRMFYVVENYQLASPVTATDNEFKSLLRDLRQSAKVNYCSSLEKRDGLFKGYSSVGSIINMANAQGDQLFSIELSKSVCVE